MEIMARWLCWVFRSKVSECTTNRKWEPQGPELVLVLRGSEGNLEKFGKIATLEMILERYKGWTPEMTELLRQVTLDELKQLLFMNCQ
jgi:hypothetical protein